MQIILDFWLNTMKMNGLSFVVLKAVENDVPCYIRSSTELTVNSFIGTVLFVVVVQ